MKDRIGFLLLFPPVRQWLTGRLATRMVVAGPAGGVSPHPREQDVIDGVKYRRED